MKNMIKSIVVLVCICAVMSLLLASVNNLTAPVIERNNNAAANEALLQVMPDGKNFETVDISAYTLPSTVTDAFKEENGGFVFKLKTAGYSSDFIIMCGVNADGTVSGAVCLSSGETLGHEKSYGDNFKGKDSAAVDTTDTISGATKTTAAYRSAVKDSLNAAVILAGGSVDIRTEEEILADNLSAALPTGEGKFTKLFLTEVIGGVDAVYTADNGNGYVCVIGEVFVGIDADGKAVGDADAENAATASAAVAVLKASELTELDPTTIEGIHKNVLAISKTATGNYVFEVKGAGYGIKGGDDYHPASGEYIVVRVAMTADGKIIDCFTVSQAETNGIGSVCADEKFYGQFVGKTETDYESIDAIAGATLTTDGYKAAIAKAYETLTLIKGGAN